MSRVIPRHWPGNPKGRQKAGGGRAFAATAVRQRAGA